jgi:hypothetical protein
LIDKLVEYLQVDFRGASSEIITLYNNHEIIANMAVELHTVSQIFRYFAKAQSERFNDFILRVNEFCTNIRKILVGTFATSMAGIKKILQIFLLNIGIRVLDYFFGKYG